MLGPGIHLLARMRLPQKLLLIAAIFVIPIFLLLVGYTRLLNQQIGAAERELLGVKVIAPVRQMIQAMQLHRGLSQQAIAGNAVARAKLPELRGKITAAVAEADRIDAEFGQTLGTHDEWAKMRGGWQALADHADGLNAEDSFRQHTETIGKVRDFLILVADHSGMTLDPDIETSYLVNAFATKIVRMTESAGIMRASSLKAIALDSLPMAQRIDLAVLLNLVSTDLADIRASLDKVEAANAVARAALEKPDAALKSSLVEYQDLVRTQVLAGERITAKGDAMLRVATTAIDAAYVLNDAARQEFTRIVEVRVERLRMSRLYSLLGVAIALLAVTYLFLAFRSALLAAIGVIGAGARRIAGGNFSEPLRIEARDELADIGGELNRTQSQLRENIEREREAANANLRIKNALDVSSNSVMLADNDGIIIYANAAAIDMFKAAEADIRRELPQFNASAVLGSNFDQYHRQSAHQRTLLAGLHGTHRAEIHIGGRSFSMAANPIINPAGERLGTVVEWRDRTAEVSIESEIAAIIAAAAAGDFGKRLATETLQGFFLELGQGINRLLEASSNAMRDIGALLDRLAHGDLTQMIETEYQGMLGKLKDDANSTVVQLRDVVTRIKQATEAVTTAAQEIAAGNRDLSSRTESQASSLEETASSMEELNTTVQQNAANAHEANTLARKSNEVASKGGEMVKRVVTTMSEIQGSSKKIADIIGVIDGIAFQTNILALNAAVEAARAGEQGRGFAVVASEVRSLAQRSATAAKEIKALIAESVDKVEGGAQLVQAAGKTMDEVVASFQNVANLVTQIADASSEQTEGIGQVTQAINQMDEVTQQNAALVEEAAATSEGLEQQARGLMRAVGMFNLGDEQVTPRALLASDAPSAAAAPRISGAARMASPARPARMALPPAHDAVEEWEEF